MSWWSIRQLTICHNILNLGQCCKSYVLLGKCCCYSRNSEVTSLPTEVEMRCLFQRWVCINCGNMTKSYNGTSQCVTALVLKTQVSKESRKWCAHTENAFMSSSSTFSKVKKMFGCSMQTYSCKLLESSFIGSYFLFRSLLSKKHVAGILTQIFRGSNLPTQQGRRLATSFNDWKNNTGNCS